MNKQPQWQDRGEQRFMGLSAAQFNIAVVVAIGAAAVGVWLFALGGKDSLLGGDGDRRAVTEGTPTTAAAPGETPAATSDRAKAQLFEWGACSFKIPEGFDVDCGVLTVPEDRGKPEGRKIRLHVGVFRSEAGIRVGDPIVYLAGGPGAKSLEIVGRIFDDWFEPFLAQRDFIILDQRGAGYSEPALNCPEILAAFVEHFDEDLSAATAAGIEADALRACRDRLVSEGVNLASFSRAESAADVEDLRLALGYEKWNLYGVSYGTRLALTVMRDFPGGLRSVVLDSSYPLQADLYAEEPANLDRALGTLFDGCAADAECNAAYPELRAVFNGVVDRLNRSPETAYITNPLTGQTFPAAVVNGDALVALLFSSLYSTEIIPILPLLIYGTAQGDTTLVALLLGGFFAEREFVSTGMHLSIQCGDEVRFSSRDAVTAAVAAYPRLRGVFEGSATLGPGVFATCEGWGAKQAAEIENQAVSSSVPTLVLAGQYDPITPPDWGRRVAETLSAVRFYEFPGTGHGVNFSGECPLGMTQEFLRDPGKEPDASCIGSMGGPEWVVE